MQRCLFHQGIWHLSSHLTWHQKHLESSEKHRSWVHRSRVRLWNLLSTKLSRWIWWSARFGIHSSKACASLVVQLVKNPSAIQETLVQLRGQKIPWRRDRLPTSVFLDFPGGSVGKESTCSAGDLGSIPGLGRSPGGGHGHPLQYSCLENPHGQRSLAGYSPWDPKELDTTERPSTAQHMIIIQRLAMQLQTFQRLPQKWSMDW